MDFDVPKKINLNLSHVVAFGLGFVAAVLMFVVLMFIGV